MANYINGYLANEIYYNIFDYLTADEIYEKCGMLSKDIHKQAINHIFKNSIYPNLSKVASSYCKGPCNIRCDVNVKSISDITKWLETNFLECIKDRFEKNIKRINHNEGTIKEVDLFFQHVKVYLH